MVYFYLRTIFFLIVPTMGVLKLPPNVTIPALIAFGDSIVDAGNNNGNRFTIAKSNFPPYGKDFMGGISTGRFSNGRVPTDLIADAISIKQYVPAYLDPNIGSDDLLTGVTFASGGVGYDPLTSQIALVKPLNQQLVQFREYIGKLTQLVGEARKEFILTNSLYMLVCGSNDIASNYFSIPSTKAHYSIDSYATLMVNNAASFVQELYSLGARRIVLFGAPPIGCVPSIRTFRGGLERNCDDNLNYLAQIFNFKLSSKFDTSNLTLPGSKIVVINIYDPLLECIQNPIKYGFEQSVKGCCGSGLYEVSIFCNKFDGVCTDDRKYLFWDGFHPTQRGYELLVNSLLKQYANRFF